MKSFKKFLAEGGIAIKTSSRINQENVKATLDDVFKKLLSTLKIKRTDVSPLGSTGKKKPGDSSGDIDLAVNVNAVIKANKIVNPKEVFPLLLKALKKHTPEINDSSGLGVVSGAWPIANVDGNQPNQFVQLDLMGVDNLELSDFTFWSPSFEQSKWKGLHRNSLLIGIASNMKFETVKTALDNDGVEVPVVFKRRFLDFRKGVVEGLQSIEGKNGQPVKTKKTLQTTVVAGTPVDIVKVLLGPDFSVSDAVSFESIWKIINSNSKFIWKKNKQQILKFAAETILTAKGTLPPELQRFA